MNTDQQKALTSFLCRQFQAAQVEILKMQLLSGGAIQENWLLDLQVSSGLHDGKPLDGLLCTVLRCDSASAGVPGSHGRSEEQALLRTVFNAGVTVPEPLLMCMDASVIGRPFFLMRKVEGTAAAHVLVKDFSFAPNRVELVRRLGAELARIHRITPPEPALAFIPVPSVSPALHRIQTYRAFLDQHHTTYPALEWGLRWLELNQPSHSTLSLCHGDFRTGNYMVDAQGLTGILDWEFASWSDPLEDIGWFCAKCWRFGRDELQAGGMGLREDFYAGYECEAGVQIEHAQVHYWEVMAHVKWAIVAIQQTERHCSGQENSLLLALTGHIVPELEWEILNMTDRR